MTLLLEAQKEIGAAFLAAFKDDWRLRALCPGKPPEWFDGPEKNELTGRKPAAYPKRVLSGVRICAECPVKQECYAYAVEHRLSGMWGGIYRKLRRANRTKLSEVVIEPETGLVLTIRTFTSDDE